MWQEALSEALQAGTSIQEIRDWLHEHGDHSSSPVDVVRWVSVERVRANNYNPNKVAPPEMKLLKLSIQEDGFTQPVVTVRDGDNFVVVDGFHRYSLARDDDEIREAHSGEVPIVVIDAPLEHRMASTVRHNRARGNHGVTGMSGLVLGMLEEGMEDAEICHELGMEPEELIRLKHITGFSKLFENTEYAKEWRSRAQVRLRLDWEREHGPGSAPI